MIKWLLFFVLTGCVWPGYGQIRPYGVWELKDAGGGLKYQNPYDYGEVAFRCRLEGPGGIVDTVDGFYMQDYALDTLSGRLRAEAGAGFRVRYSPRVAGKWKYRCWYEGRGVRRGPSGSFLCGGRPDGHGFVRKDQRRWLFFEDSTQFVPIGENMGWANGNAYLDYRRWIDKLSGHGGNFVRVWMPSWGLGIEWSKGHGPYNGLGQYQQEHAWYLDWLLEHCRSKGVYLMLTLDHHGQVSSKVDPNWNENPYNARNGGPCVNTWDFFTDSEARRLIQNRFRYIVARYGYSTAIACWELFNEVDWTDDFERHRPEVASWHHAMAQWLRRLDPNRHLISTSYGNARYDSLSWGDLVIDITQTHFYITTSFLEHILDSAGTAYWRRYGKPTLNAEFGLGGDAGSLREIDPGGIHIHNAMWGSLLGGGGFGAAMSWWWDNYIDPMGLYVHFDGLSRFAGGLDLLRGNYAPAAVSVEGGIFVRAMRSEDGRSFAGWVLNQQYNWQYVKQHGQPSAVEGGFVSFGGVKDGRYALRWVRCADGVVDGESLVYAEGGWIRLSCPPVLWDHAFTLRYLD